MRTERAAVWVVERGGGASSGPVHAVCNAEGLRHQRTRRASVQGRTRARAAPPHVERAHDRVRVHLELKVLTSPSLLPFAFLIIYLFFVFTFPVTVCFLDQSRLHFFFGLYLASSTELPRSPSFTS